MVFFWEEPQPQRARPKFTQREKEIHYTAQGGKCNGCNKKFDIRNLTVDHIKAFSKGGGERGHNLQLLCGACNSLKGNGTMGQLKKRLASEGVVKGPSKPAKKTSSKTPTKKKRPRKPKDPMEEFFKSFGL